jgi:hypothetical protein
VDANESTDAADPAEPMESTEQAEPTEPIERTEPTEPIERIDPSLAIERSEALERGDPGVFMLSGLTPQVVPPPTPQVSATR